MKKTCFTFPLKYKVDFLLDPIYAEWIAKYRMYDTQQTLPDRLHILIKLFT